MYLLGATISGHNLIWGSKQKFLLILRYDDERHYISKNGWTLPLTEYKGCIQHNEQPVVNNVFIRLNCNVQHILRVCTHMRIHGIM